MQALLDDTRELRTMIKNHLIKSIKKLCSEKKDITPVIVISALKFSSIAEC